MRKYVVEVRMWVKQVRPGGRSGEYEMSGEEADDLVHRLVEQGMNRNDINVREV